MSKANLQVAKIIHEQLMALGKIKVWSWGAHAWQGGKDFLIFKVQGLKLKGRVKITLHPSDYYIIEFFKGQEKINPIHKVDNVFFDEMIEVIDNYVEYTGATYENDVKRAIANEDL